MHIPTQEIICKALEELLQSSSMDKITVRMVCEKAGISRQALYNHYYSLIAVLEDMITRQMKQALGEQNANLTWESGFERILSCMREHKMMLLHVYRSKAGTSCLASSSVTAARWSAMPSLNALQIWRSTCRIRIWCISCACMCMFSSA